MTNEELFTGAAISTWKLALSRLDQLTTPLSNEQLQQEVAPSRNRIYYLLGHFTAVHDRLFPLLGLGERLHPELDEVFITNPDKASPDKISAADLRKTFADVNTRLTAAIETLPAADWLKKHASVSEEDFAREPLRNRISILQSRTAHAMFHAGQITLTTKR